MSLSTELRMRLEYVEEQERLAAEALEAKGRLGKYWEPIYGEGRSTRKDEYLGLECKSCRRRDPDEHWSARHAPDCPVWELESSASASDARTEHVKRPFCDSCPGDGAHKLSCPKAPSDAAPIVALLKLRDELDGVHESKPGLNVRVVDELTAESERLGMYGSEAPKTEAQTKKPRCYHPMSAVGCTICAALRAMPDGALKERMANAFSDNGNRGRPVRAAAFEATEDENGVVTVYSDGQPILQMHRSAWDALNAELDGAVPSPPFEAPPGTLTDDPLHGEAKYYRREKP